MEPQPMITPVSKSKNHTVVWIAAGTIILAIGIGVGLVLGKYLPKPKQITSYEDCMKDKGSSVQESNPPTCVTANGLRFKGPVASPTLTPDPTANWKTYKDQKYEFKYPDYWKSQHIPDNSRLLLSLKSPTEINISFDLLENFPGDGPGLECEIESKQQKIDINQSTITKFFNTGINDDSCGNSGSRTIWALLGKSNNYYSDYLIIRYSVATAQTAESVFDQILSTFRFVEQATPTPRTTCKPRPACLDTNPRCLIPETSDMCPPNQKL